MPKKLQITILRGPAVCLDANRTQAKLVDEGNIDSHIEVYAGSLKKLMDYGYKSWPVVLFNGKLNDPRNWYGWRPKRIDRTIDASLKNQP